MRVKKGTDSCLERREHRCIFDQLGPSYESTRNVITGDLIQIDEPTGGAACGDTVAAGSVARERTVNQQVSHGRRDFGRGIGDADNQHLTRQRAPLNSFSSPGFTKGQVPRDFTGADSS